MGGFSIGSTDYFQVGEDERVKRVRLISSNNSYEGLWKLVLACEGYDGLVLDILERANELDEIGQYLSKVREVYSSMIRNIPISARGEGENYEAVCAMNGLRRILNEIGSE